MYVGHFAAGLALKAKAPRVPTWILLVGVGVLDILFGPFVLAGIERVSLTAAQAPGFSLDYIDWSHSLLMSLVWSIGFGLLFLRRGREVAVWAGVAVFSHVVLDLLMHPPDIALWPGSATHLGLGIWRRLPTGWWFVELAFIALCFGYYWSRARRDESFGGRPIGVAVTLLVLHLLNSPWLSAV